VTDACKVLSVRREGIVTTTLLFFLGCGGRVLSDTGPSPPASTNGGPRAQPAGSAESSSNSSGGGGERDGTAPSSNGAASNSGGDASGAASNSSGGSTLPVAATTDEPPSCASSAPGSTDCGLGHESCCSSLVVMGGTFDRTYTNNGSGLLGQADAATVSSFRLDKYLVTVGRFRRFVSAWSDGQGWLPAEGSGKHAHLNGGLGLANGGDAGTYESGWQASDDAQIAPTDTNLACPSWPTWTPSAGTQEDLPINCASWWDAYAFCIWDGGFLPSEAELQYAAAGGAEEREYPWGSEDAASANQYAIYGCDYPGGSTCGGAGNIAPVGTARAGAGLWGQLDLAGDLFEWNLDSWSSGYLVPCSDCANFSDPSTRVTRGGAFDTPETTLLCTNRTLADPAGRYGGQGFRCARRP
jgi:sulfatase modifying factor 1